MRRIVDSLWFLIIEFSCITLAAFLWKNIPGLSWQPLIIAIAPIILRTIVGRSPLTRTPFDIPISIFLFTAAVGVWVAYQPAGAFTKFWLILASILFYYLLARQPADNLWKISGALCLLGCGISIYFFLSNNWEVQPQKFRLLSQIGIAWMQVRSNIRWVAIHPNDIAGIASLTLPFSLALALECWKRKSALGSIFFGLTSALILAAVIMSSSRGAWMALVVTAVLWIGWQMTGKLGIKSQYYRKILYILTFVILICLAVGYFWTVTYGKINQIAIGKSDVSVSDQRFHVFWSDIELIKDVPFTGGGLDNFSGLYSSYILINPNYILGYGHNIFLDATLEQGILGGLMLLWVYLGSILWLILRPGPAPHSFLRIAVITSLLIILFHGLVDDIVYRTSYIPLLFFVPGMAVGLLASTNPEPKRIWLDKSQMRRLGLPVMIALGSIVVVLIIFRQPLISAWYSNLGAVEMAKVELADFPTGTWDEGQDTGLYSSAEALFLKAITQNPANPNAHYRLGLIAMVKRDFPTAVDHLERAHRGDPYHRGIIKAMGLSYLWNGEVNKAQTLLSRIPEARQEVGVYSWWWGEQNRNDLVAYAEQYLELAEPDQ